MSARLVLEAWVDRFNAGDADGLAQLYHVDAVNHQVTQEPVCGREAIRSMFAREFATATMVCIPEAIHEAGDVIALEWRESTSRPHDAQDEGEVAGGARKHSRPLGPRYSG